MYVYDSKECESAMTDNPKKAETREKGGICKNNIFK